MKILQNISLKATLVSLRHGGGFMVIFTSMFIQIPGDVTVCKYNQSIRGDMHRWDGRHASHYTHLKALHSHPQI